MWLQGSLLILEEMNGNEAWSLNCSYRQSLALGPTKSGGAQHHLHSVSIEDANTVQPQWLRNGIPVFALPAFWLHLNMFNILPGIMNKIFTYEHVWQPEGCLRCSSLIWQAKILDSSNGPVASSGATVSYKLIPKKSPHKDDDCARFTPPTCHMQA